MGRRRGLSTVLILGAIVLVAAIFVGNNMGTRVLGQISSRADDNATPIPIPSPSAADAVANRTLWKRRQVLSVATDPAFPDPRVTPEPEIPATPKPLPRATKSIPTPQPTDDLSDTTTPAPSPSADTTSPLPTGSQPAEATNAPPGSPTATPRSPASTRPPGTPRVSTQRSTPSLPPVTIPSFNP